MNAQIAACRILAVLALAFPMVGGLSGCSGDLVSPIVETGSHSEPPAVSEPITEGMSSTEHQDVAIATAEQVASLEKAEAVAHGKQINATRVLSVKFGPQVPPGVWELSMSCGPAATNMSAAYAYGAVLDQYTYIRAINRYLGKSDINNCLPGGTNTAQLVRAAKSVNGCANTSSASGWTLARLRQEIDAGRPVVVAVRAGALPNRGYGYVGGHFVLVVGYDSYNMICHDPGTRYGANKAYANSHFANAMATYGGSVVIVRR